MHDHGMPSFARRACNIGYRRRRRIGKARENKGTSFPVSPRATLCYAAHGREQTKRRKPMPLYLDEIWLNETSADNVKKIHKMFQGVLSGASGFPEGVTLKAGPWASNEEAK